MPKPIFSKPSIKVFKSTAKNQNFMVIPDLHIPFEHKRALQFCIDVRELFDIPEENIISTGDELDLYHFGRWPKDGNYAVTPSQEIELIRKRLRKWEKAFPLMKVCHSNHGARYWKKAQGAEIPTQVLRSYREIFEIPRGWEYEECFVPNVKSPFAVIHGDQYGSGKNVGWNAMLHMGISVAHGHVHSLAEVRHMKIGATGKEMWCANAGALLDQESFAFNYAKMAKYGSSLGVLVVLDSGRCPIWIPLK